MTFQSWAKITPHAGTGQESFLRAHKKHIKADQGLRALFVFIRQPWKTSSTGEAQLFCPRRKLTRYFRWGSIGYPNSRVRSGQATKKTTTSEEPRKQCWVYISIYYINKIRKGRGYFPPLKSGGGGGHFSLVLPTLDLRLCLNYLK